MRSTGIYERDGLWGFEIRGWGGRYGFATKIEAEKAMLNSSGYRIELWEVSDEAV